MQVRAKKALAEGQLMNIHAENVTDIADITSIRMQSVFLYTIHN